MLQIFFAPLGGYLSGLIFCKPGITEKSFSCKGGDLLGIVGRTAELFSSRFVCDVIGVVEAVWSVFYLVLEASLIDLARLLELLLEFLHLPFELDVLELQSGGKLSYKSVDDV